ncbi:MAG: hypothetical protein FJW31_25020 [Acidobacteria bacterium]|nr:hypothetical protein [Acidobacteriota bacterium]
MFKSLPVTVLALLSASAVCSAATEYTLLPLVPDDAGSIVGFDAGRMLNSHFGRRILDKM